MDPTNSGVVFNGAVVCLGVAGFLVSAILTLCRVFWKTSVTPVVTNCNPPKAACQILARSLEQVHATAVEAILASPQQSLISLEDDSTIASAPSEAGPSRSATLDEVVDEKNSKDSPTPSPRTTSPPDSSMRSASPRDQPTPLPPKEPYPFLQEVPPRTTSRAPKRSKSLRCLKRARSLGARQRDLDPPTHTYPAAHSTALSSTSTEAHPDIVAFHSHKCSLDSSSSPSEPSTSASDRSPPRGLRKYLSLHWHDRHSQGGASSHPPTASSSSQETTAKLQKKQSKTLRKVRSELRPNGADVSVTSGLPVELPPRRHSDKDVRLPQPPSPPDAVSSHAVFPDEQPVNQPPQSFSPPPRVDSQLPSLGKSSKKKQPVARTDPYAAPYFFPAPGSPEAAEYTNVKRLRTTRSATLPPTNSFSVHFEDSKKQPSHVPDVPPLPPAQK